MLLIEGNANCSPLESKAKGRSSTGFQPSFGLFLICSSIVILALIYNMICVFKISVEIFSSYMHVKLTALKSIWRCKTTCYVGVVQDSNQGV
ncbi:hypothetical protein AAZX31_17G185100 [Glycine max]